MSDADSESLIGQLEQELLETRQQVEELRERVRIEIEQRGELLTVVSHELRTPITVIAGYNRLLLSDQVGHLNDEQRHFLTESSKSCKRLDSFVETLMEATGRVHGASALNLKDVPLEPLCSGVASFLRPLLEEAGQSIEIHIDADASVARIDSVRIEQVLTNLIHNAIKYAPSSEPIRIASRRIEAPGGASIEISVSDAGPGIATSDARRIFYPYVRLTGSDSPGGLGLGLAICRRIVEAHGGSISVASHPVAAGEPASSAEPSLRDVEATRGGAPERPGRPVRRAGSCFVFTLPCGCGELGSERSDPIERGSCDPSSGRGD